MLISQRVTQQLLVCIKAFKRQSKWADATMSKRIFGNDKVIPALRRGEAKISLPICDRAIINFAKAGLDPWPEDVPQPTAAELKRKE